MHDSLISRVVHIHTKFDIAAGAESIPVSKTAGDSRCVTRLTAQDFRLLMFIGRPQHRKAHSNAHSTYPAA